MNGFVFGPEQTQTELNELTHKAQVYIWTNNI